MLGICSPHSVTRELRAFGSVMSVSDVKRRNLGKRTCPRLGFRETPDLLLRALWTLEAVDRLAFCSLFKQAMYGISIAKRQKDQSRLSFDGEKVAGAVFYFI